MGQEEIETIHYNHLIEYFKDAIKDEIYPLSYPRNESGFDVESLEYEIRTRLQKYEKLKNKKK